MVKVSEEEMDSIYNNSVLLLKNSPNKNAKEDYNITLQTLTQVTNLRIDMDKIEDLSFLKNYPNLEYLTLFNAQNLTREDIKYINQNPFHTLCLGFSIPKLLYAEKQIELGTIHKEIIMDKPHLDEMEGVMFLNCFDRLPPYFYEDAIISQQQKIDEKIGKIIGDMHMENLDDWGKLVTIMDYITAHIRYDEQVKAKIYRGYYGMDSKSLYYNEHPLSSVLNENGQIEVEGICVNYASLMTVLCKKVHLPVYKISGFSNLGYGGHAWNLIALDSKNAYIDLTNDDNDEIFHTYLTNYLLSKDILEKENYREKLEELVFKDIDDFEIEFTPDERIEYFMANPKNVSYINAQIEGKQTYNGNLNYTGPIIIGIGNGLLVVVLSNFIKKRQKIYKKFK